MNMFLIFVAHTNKEKYLTTKISQSAISTSACNNVCPCMYTCTSIVLGWGHECMYVVAIDSCTGCSTKDPLISQCPV